MSEAIKQGLEQLEHQRITAEVPLAQAETRKMVLWAAGLLLLAILLGAFSVGPPR